MQEISLEEAWKINTQDSGNYTFSGLLHNTALSFSASMPGNSETDPIGLKPMVPFSF